MSEDHEFPNVGDVAALWALPKDILVKHLRLARREAKYRAEQDRTGGLTPKQAHVLLALVALEREGERVDAASIEARMVVHGYRNDAMQWDVFGTLDRLTARSHAYRADPDDREKPGLAVWKNDRYVSTKDGRAWADAHAVGLIGREVQKRRRVGGESR